MEDIKCEIVHLFQLFMTLVSNAYNNKLQLPLLNFKIKPSRLISAHCGWLVDSKIKYKWKYLQFHDNFKIIILVI